MKKEEGDLNKKAEKPIEDSVAPNAEAAEKKTGDIPVKFKRGNSPRGSRERKLTMGSRSNSPQKIANDEVKKANKSSSRRRSVPRKGVNKSTPTKRGRSKSSPTRPTGVRLNSETMKKRLSQFENKKDSQDTGNEQMRLNSCSPGERKVTIWRRGKSSQLNNIEVAKVANIPSLKRRSVPRNGAKKFSTTKRGRSTSTPACPIAVSVKSETMGRRLSQFEKKDDSKKTDNEERSVKNVSPRRRRGTGAGTKLPTDQKSSGRGRGNSSPRKGRGRGRGETSPRKARGRGRGETSPPKTMGTALLLEETSPRKVTPRGLRLPVDEAFKQEGNGFQRGSLSQKAVKTERRSIGDFEDELEEKDVSSKQPVRGENDSVKFLSQKSDGTRLGQKDVAKQKMAKREKRAYKPALRRRSGVPDGPVKDPKKKRSRAAGSQTINTGPLNLSQNSLQQVNRRDDGQVLNRRRSSSFADNPSGTSVKSKRSSGRSNEQLTGQRLGRQRSHTVHGVPTGSQRGQRESLPMGSERPEWLIEYSKKVEEKDSKKRTDEAGSKKKSVPQKPLPQMPPGSMNDGDSKQPAIENSSRSKALGQKNPVKVRSRLTKNTVHSNRKSLTRKSVGPSKGNLLLKKTSLERTSLERTSLERISRLQKATQFEKKDVKEARKVGKAPPKKTVPTKRKSMADIKDQFEKKEVKEAGKVGKTPPKKIIPTKRNSIADIKGQFEKKEAEKSEKAPLEKGPPKQNSAANMKALFERKIARQCSEEVDEVKTSHRKRAATARNSRSSHKLLSSRRGSLRGDTLDRFENPHELKPKSSIERDLTPLCLAAKEGNLEVVKKIFESSKNPLAPGKLTGRTPLHYACEFVKGKKCEQVIEFFVAKGNPIDFVCGERGAVNKAPLHLAAEKGNIWALRYLLKKGADMQGLDSKGNTALNLAAQNGHHTVTKILCQKDEIKLRDILNQLCTAGRFSLTKVCADKLTVLCGELNSSQSKLSSLQIRSAVQALLDDDDIVISKEDRALLKEKVWSVDVKNKEGNSALLSACEKGHVKVVEQLLKHGVDVNIIDRDKDEVDLNVEDQTRQYGLNGSMLDGNNGSVGRSNNKKGRSGLLLATVNNRPAVVKILLKHEVTLVNAKDFDGNGACHLAAQREQKDNVKTLKYLRKCERVNINAENNKSRTPLHEAVLSENLYAIKEFLKSDNIDANSVGGTNDTPVHLAVEEDCLDALNVLCVSEKIDLNTLVARNESALFRAVENGNFQAITVLLECGVDPNLADSVMSTPLHNAVIENSLTSVALLCSNAGINVNAINEEYKTPLDIAVERYAKGVENKLRDEYNALQYKDLPGDAKRKHQESLDELKGKKKEACELNGLQEVQEEADELERLEKEREAAKKLRDQRPKRAMSATIKRFKSLLDSGENFNSEYLGEVAVEEEVETVLVEEKPEEVEGLQEVLVEEVLVEEQEKQEEEVQSTIDVNILGNDNDFNSLLQGLTGLSSEDLTFSVAPNNNFLRPTKALSSDQIEGAFLQGLGAVEAVAREESIASQEKEKPEVVEATVPSDEEGDNDKELEDILGNVTLSGISMPILEGNLPNGTGLSAKNEKPRLRANVRESVLLSESKISELTNALPRMSTSPSQPNFFTSPSNGITNGKKICTQFLSFDMVRNLLDYKFLINDKVAAGDVFKATCILAAYNDGVELERASPFVCSTNSKQRMVFQCLDQECCDSLFKINDKLFSEDINDDTKFYLNRSEKQIVFPCKFGTYTKQFWRHTVTQFNLKISKASRGGTSINFKVLWVNAEKIKKRHVSQQIEIINNINVEGESEVQGASSNNNLQN